MSTVGMLGFNLLPYRSGARRRARNRTAAMLAGAGLAGCAAVGVVAGWDALERARIDKQREAVETQLRALRIPVAEHARLTEDEALRRRAQAVLHFALEDLDEHAANGLALLFWINQAREGRHEV